MNYVKNTNLRDTIQYHIDNGMIIDVKRIFNDQIDILRGFPIKISNEFLLTTVINDFRDEGYAILLTRDIIDAYSNERDLFYEKICISEGLQSKVKQDCITNLNSLKQIVLQLKNYEGLICVQCEYQLEKCSFFMGKIITVEDDCISFLDVGMDGMWDIDAHKICFDEITQISYGDNYSKSYYKYVE